MSEAHNTPLPGEPREAGPRRVLRSVSLSRVQTVVGLVAGLLSIVGAVTSIPTFWKAAPGTGNLVAIVQDARSERAVTEATVEVLTVQDAVVTTLVPNYSGRVRYTLQEGAYRLRVSHPRFGAESRPVQVVGGQTTEVHVRLRPTSPADHAGQAVRAGVGSVKRFLGL
jgi:hypothetical protein